PVLARSLAELRATVADIEQAHRTGSPAGKLVHHQAALERQIRDHCRRRPGEPGTPPAQPPSARLLGQALGRAALLEFLEADEVLYALSLVDGDIRLHRLGDAGQARPLADALSLAVHRLATAGLDQDGEAGWAGLRHRARQLDEALLHPL